MVREGLGSMGWDGPCVCPGFRFRLCEEMLESCTKPAATTFYMNFPDTILGRQSSPKQVNPKSLKPNPLKNLFEFQQLMMPI